MIALGAVGDLIVNSTSAGVCPAGYTYVEWNDFDNVLHRVCVLTTSSSTASAPAADGSTTVPPIVCPSGMGTVYLNGQWVCVPPTTCPTGTTKTWNSDGSWSCVPPTSACPTCPTCAVCPSPCPTGYARNSAGTCVKVYSACQTGYARNNAGACVPIYPAPTPCPTPTCPACPPAAVCPACAACPEPTLPPRPDYPPCPPQRSFPWFWAVTSGLAIGMTAWGLSLRAAR